MDKKEYKIIDHIVIKKELNELFPRMDDQEFAELKNSIREKGYDVAEGGKIILWYCDDGMDQDNLDEIPPHILVEGHHRFRACQDLYEETGDEKYLLTDDCFDVRYFDDINDVKLWMIQHQVGRRNLSKYAKFEVYYRNIDGLREKARQRQCHGKNFVDDGKCINIRKELATMTGVSEGTIRKYMQILRSKNEEIIERLKTDDKWSADAAYKELKRQEKQKKQDPSKNKEGTGTKSPIDKIRDKVADQLQKYGFSIDKDWNLIPITKGTE